jgi:methionyl-tRNA formyltransferase
MKLAVAATAPFGADVLRGLARRHEVAYLLTRPDRPRGRGRKLGAPPAKALAEELGIEVRQPERPGDLADLGVDVVVAAAYGALIPKKLLDQALWLNIHPSLLPRWRGAAPVERAIMAGDTRTGVAIIRLVEELDAGPIGGSGDFAIGPDDDAGVVFQRAADMGCELLDGVLVLQTFKPQEGEPTYAEKIRPADRELDWSRPAEELHNRIRALSPYIGARGELHGRPLIVWRSRLVDGELEILEVQPEGRRRMTLEEFERGLRV